MVAYDPTTGEGSTTKDETYTADWTNDVVRKGLTIKLSVIAAQGDYPYTQMDTTTATASAVIPTNKVVKADSITSSESGSTDAVSNVVLDFSNVSKTTDSSSTENNITGTKVTAEVTSISSTDSTVTIDLNLYSVSGETSTPITDPQFDAPVVITMTVPGKITEPKITYNGVEDGKILSSTINSNNTTTVVFSVTHFSEYVIADTLVTTAEGLQASLNAGGYVELGNSIDVQSEDDKSGTAFVSEVSGTVLDLNGCTISTDITCLIDVQESLGIRNGELKCDYTDGGRVINIDGDSVEKQGGGAAENMTLTLKDVDVVGPTGDGYNRGISVWGTKDLTINTDFPFYAVMMFWGSGYFQSPRTSLSHR